MKVTDERLEELCNIPPSLGLNAQSAQELRELARELRALRAAVPTAAEREAIRVLVADVRELAANYKPGAHAVALPALDRLRALGGA